jgi:NADPH-dependent curcumin reductase
MAFGEPSDCSRTDRLPATMREILSKSLTLRGFVFSEFVERYFRQFLREVGALIADGRERYREDVADSLEKAPEAFVGTLDGRNFCKAIIRIEA